jgi:hypothetical protein
MISTTAPSSDDYVLELVLPDSRRVRRLGHGSDMKAAFKALGAGLTPYSPTSFCAMP